MDKRCLLISWRCHKTVVSTGWDPLQPISQWSLSCFSGPSLIFFCFSVGLDGIFLEHPENSSVTACVVDGGGFRLDVWQRAAREQRYLRNAFSDSPLLRKSRGKSKTPKRLPPRHASKVCKSRQVPVTKSLEKHSFPFFNCSPFSVPLPADPLLSCPHAAAGPAGQTFSPMYPLQ